MCQSRAKCLLITLLILGYYQVSAQTSASSGNNTSNPLSERENNPYSKYGIGELWDGNNVVLKGMANITSAYENPYQVNSDNPASYCFLQRTTFEAGAEASSRFVNGSGRSYNTGTGSLSYLSLGIPVNKHVGMCMGFRPFSKSYYSLLDTVNNSPVGQVTRSYNGQGALSYAYVGAAVQFKGLSVGFNVGYMFGTLTNFTATIPIDTNLTNRAYDAEFANYNRIGGIYWKGGIMYETKLDSDYTLRFGGTFSMQQNLLDRLNAYQISVYNFGDTIINDTMSYPGEQRGKLRLPTSFSAGAMLVKNNKWGLGIDYTNTRWNNFQSSLDSTLTLNVAKQSYKISLGGEYTPDVNDIRNYFSRATYRFGIYYGTDYLIINNTQLPTYGVTVGASLPFRRSLSHIHGSLDFGRLGTTTNNLIQQTYVRFSLGFSFNDKWFLPRRYE